MSDPGGYGPGIYVSGYAEMFRPDDVDNPFHRIYEQKRRAVLDHFSSRERLQLVDVGGGPGRLTAPLAQHHDVTMVDISDEMIEKARAVSPEHTRFVQADARRLPFENGQFDGLLSLDLLCHVPDLEEGIRELARVVRPGAHMLFDTTNALPLWALTYPSYVGRDPRRIAKTLWLRGVLPEWSSTVRHDRAGTVRNAIAAAGLELQGMRRFGRAGLAKWHLWHAVKPTS